MTTPVTTDVAREAGSPREYAGATQHSHGAGAPVPVQTRSERPVSYDVADFSVPTNREAAWKYSPVAKLAPLFAEGLDGSRVEAGDPGVDGVKIAYVGRDDARIGQAGIPEDRSSANAWSSFQEALVVEVSGEEQKTAIIERSGFGDAARAAHVIVDVKQHARGLVILRHTGAAKLAENVEILVGDGANVTIVSLQEWDDEALHASSHFIAVGRDAYVKHIVVSLGGDVVRLNPTLHLNDQGADGELFGLYYADAGQHLEQQVYVDHAAPHTRSRVNYKGALQGEGARSVWIGDVLIRREAEGTDSYEENRNLILSDGTRADSVPNLEIETGDIEGAGHASATGRFDDEQLFYLMARGISEAQARRLVVHGFLNEIVQQIDSEEIASQLQEMLERELERSGNALLGAAQ